MLCRADSISISAHALLVIQKQTDRLSLHHLFAEVKQEICILLNTKDINKI